MPLFVWAWWGLVDGNGSLVGQAVKAGDGPWAISPSMRLYLSFTLSLVKDNGLASTSTVEEIADADAEISTHI